MTNFVKNSYEKHTEEFNVVEENELKKQATWFEEDNVDYWRHFRMIEPVSPLLKLNPGSKWLTVGDGRFGLDSVRLKKIEPSIDVLPSDISPYLLGKSKEMGHISKFSVENAEQLSFDDDAFDYAFCKEAYHHFPRPQIALHEMLRVSKKAIVFIEPNDHTDIGLMGRMLQAFKRGIKNILGRNDYHHDHFKFEESGNYIYSLSRRELEKMALGINLRFIAYHYLDDAYLSGVEFEKVAENGPLYKKIKQEISKKTRTNNLGLTAPGLIVGIIFKQAPSKQEKEGLEKEGFVVKELPKNPFAS